MKYTSIFNTHGTGKNIFHACGISVKNNNLFYTIESIPYND